MIVLTLPDEKITKENLNKVLEIAKDKGFEPTLEIKRLDDDPDNPYLGIQISLKDTNGTYSELQVSTPSLFKVKESTETIYKDIGVLGKSDEDLRKKKDLIAKMRKVYSDFLTGNTPLQSFFTSSRDIGTESSQSSTTYSDGHFLGPLDHSGSGIPVENQPLSDLKNKLPMPRSLSNQSTKKYSPGLSENSAMPQFSDKPTIAQNEGKANDNESNAFQSKGEIKRNHKKNIKRFKVDNGDILLNNSW